MILYAIINLLILLFMPFLMLGIIKKTKAFWGGRKGVSIFQPFYDFIRLLKKAPVISETTSFVFKIAPVITLATVIFAGFLIPMIGGFSIISTDFSFIIFAYTLGLGKFFSIISAMDTGSSFEGMGASREACFTSLIEPAFFIIMSSICAFVGVFRFESLNMLWFSKDILSFCILILSIAALTIMILIECSRVPFDDPNTHLELTMVHEVMILDNSGVDLALLSWASAIKMTIISALIACLIIPFNLPYILHLLLFVGLLCFISTIIGTIESGIARFRMTHIFEFVFTMTAIALIVLSLITIRIFNT